MSTDRRPFRYKDPTKPYGRDSHVHDPESLIFCAGCETFAVLRQVEGFHEELPRASDETIHAVEAAALRGFRMGLELATRVAIDRHRLAEIERECAGFLA